MNRYLLRIGLFGLLPLLTITAQADLAIVPPPAGYHLVWSDEFSKDPDGLPDPAKWGYEVGYFRNREAQYYTRDRLENARIEKGKLVIEGRKEDYAIRPNGTENPAIAHYTSASLTTLGKADWLYGRIEVRAQLPAGKGVWPAIWTLGSNRMEKGYGWPRCGEIDIMELVGKEPNIIHGTIHYFVDDKHASKGDKISITNTDTGFHIYVAEWTPEKIDLFVDDKKYFSFTVRDADNEGQNPFHKSQYLILNLALGGSWGGEIDDSIFPQRMVVDYVRVYQKQPATPEVGPKRPASSANRPVDGNVPCAIPSIAR